MECGADADSSCDAIDAEQDAAPAISKKGQSHAGSEEGEGGWRKRRARGRRCGGVAAQRDADVDRQAVCMWLWAGLSQMLCCKSAALCCFVFVLCLVSLKPHIVP